MPNDMTSSIVGHWDGFSNILCYAKRYSPMSTNSKCLINILIKLIGVKYFQKYLSQVQVLFHTCKYMYKYSKYLDGIKYTKYFFYQVQVPSTLVTINNTESLDPKLISAVIVVKFQFHSYRFAIPIPIFSIPPVSIPIPVLELQLSCNSNSGIEYTPILHAMAWQRTGDKLLLKPLVTRTLSPYGVTRPQ